MCCKRSNRLSEGCCGCTHRGTYLIFVGKGGNGYVCGQPLKDHSQCISSTLQNPIFPYSKFKDVETVVKLMRQSLSELMNPGRKTGRKGRCTMAFHCELSKGSE